MEKLTSIWQIDEKMIKEIGNRNDEKSYHDELKRLFQIYRKILKDLTWDGENSVYSKEKDDINKYIRKIHEIFRFHSKGMLTEFNVKTNNLFRIRANTTSAQFYFPKRTIEKDNYWFRVREVKNAEKYEVCDLFHVPFAFRGKIGTARFSIPGYPCLYLASTLKCARESIGSPGIVAASCLKNRKSFTAYDFSFFPIENGYNIVNLRNAVVSYPFKIASAIATRKNDEHKEDKYREEYIIPQLLLHCAIRQCGQKKVAGFLYSSMSAIKNINLSCEEYSQYLNLAVPSVFGIRRFCSILVNMFSITPPKVIAFNYRDKTQIEEIEKTLRKGKFLTIKND